MQVSDFFAYVAEVKKLRQAIQAQQGAMPEASGAEVTVSLWGGVGGSDGCLVGLGCVGVGESRCRQLRANHGRLLCLKARNTTFPGELKSEGSAFNNRCLQAIKCMIEELKSELLRSTSASQEQHQRMFASIDRMEAMLAGAHS